MAPSLDDAFLKLRRAKVHADALKAELAEQEHAVGVTRYVDRDRRCFGVAVESLPTLPKTLGVIAGDWVTNLRATLDYLIYELVALDNRGVYDARTQFPIADYENRLSGRDKRTLKLLSHGHRALIERHQPYRGPDWENWHLTDLAFKNPLRIVRDMSNQDKHRLLVPTYASIRVDEFEILACRDCVVADSGVFAVGAYSGPLEPGAEFIHIPLSITGTDPQVDVNLNLTAYISFAERMDASKVVDLLGAKVTEIIREFESCFEAFPAACAHATPRH